MAVYRTGLRLSHLMSDFSLRLESLSVENFRAFNKEIKFDFKPITILTGTNNSGKSNLIKALMLLKNSYQKTGLIELDLMNTQLKLGELDTVFNYNSKSRKTKFDLVFSYRWKIYRTEFLYENAKLKSFKIHKDNILIFTALLNYNETGYEKLSESFVKLNSSIVNKEKIADVFSFLSHKEQELLLNSIVSFLENEHNTHIFHPMIDSVEINDFTDYITSVFTGLENLGIYRDELIGNEDNEELIRHYYAANPQIKHMLPVNLKKKITAEYKNLPLSDFILKDNFRSIMKEFDIFSSEIGESDKFSEFFQKMDFIGAVRGKQEIIFTKENTPEDTFNLLEKSVGEDNFPYKRLEEWLVGKLKLISLSKNQELKDIFKIKPIAGYGYIVSFIVDNKEVDITSFGYGVMQLLPVLLKLVLHDYGILIIEEPESNLHPAYQSKLADIFAEIITENRYPLIIETHSEYLIRKLQYLTASLQSKLNKDKTVIYYFYPPKEIPKGEKQVKQINILENGYLSDDFGTGFFDEASKIAISLYGLQNSQNN